MKKIMFNDRYGLTEAVIEGRKTITRRLVDPKQKYMELRLWQPSLGIYGYTENDGWVYIKPKYHLGEIVAVTQDYSHCGGIMSNGVPRWKYISKVVGPSSSGWRNKMFVRADLMLHQIRITGIRVERLQDISDEDCLSEGVRYIPKIDIYYFERTYCEEGYYFRTPREAFAALIDKVSGKGIWDKNPYVFVYEFELVK